MLFSISIVFSLSLCIWSLWKKNRISDYLHAVGITIAFAFLLAQKISLVGTIIVVSSCFLLLFLLLSTSIATKEDVKRKIYKKYYGRIIVFIILIVSLSIVFNKIVFSNITFNSLRINEDLIILLILFFVSLSISKIERKN